MKNTGWMMSMLILGLVSQGFGAMGVATMKGTSPDSSISGTIKFEDTKDGLKLSGQLQNLTPGEKGFHIHEYGDCSDEGKAAGGHYNPDQKPHGQVLKDGLSKAHVGDLGNITVNDQGIATVDVTVPKVMLTGGKYNVAGRAVVVHEKMDDFGQPTGNAGGRIACGPIVLTK